MKRQKRFYVEVRLDGDYSRVWVKASWWVRVGPAVNSMRYYDAVRDEDGARVFRSVRIRFRGLTLDQVGEP